MTASNPETDAEFGSGAAIDGNTIVIGSSARSGTRGSEGAVYVFDATTGNQRLRLTPSAHLFDSFGIEIAIDDDLIAIGSPAYDHPDDGLAAAYLFGAKTGDELQKITLDGNAPQFFGRGVDLADGSLIIGAPATFEDVPPEGMVYLYDIPEPCTLLLAAACCVVNRRRQR